MGNDVIAATKFLLSSKKEELDLFCITSKTKKKNDRTRRELHRRQMFAQYQNLLVRSVLKKSQVRCPAVANAQRLTKPPTPGAVEETVMLDLAKVVGKSFPNSLHRNEALWLQITSPLCFRAVGGQWDPRKHCHGIPCHFRC